MVKKVFAFSSVVLFLWTAAFSQQSQVSLLNDAYKTNSSKKLKLFIDRWANSSAAARKKINISKNDTTDAALALYRDFFLHVNEWLLQATEKQPVYIVLNDQLDLVVIDSLPIEDPRDNMQVELNFMQLHQLSYESGHYEKQLTSFIPSLNLPHVRLLSLSDTYRTMLEHFLKAAPGTKRKSEYGEMEAMGGHDEMKVKFLSPYLPMVQRHWGHYWNYNTYPDVRRIVLDRSLTRAIVSYHHSSSSGIACYIKKSDGWVLLESRTMVTQ